MMTYIFNTETI